MNKRQISLSDDENYEGENPTKQIKRSQTENLEENLVNAPSTSKQTQLTNFFSKAETTVKNNRSDEEEQKISTQQDDKTTATEIVIESDSDLSYYRFN